MNLPVSRITPIAVLVALSWACCTESAEASAGGISGPFTDCGLNCRAARAVRSVDLMDRMPSRSWPSPSGEGASTPGPLTLYGELSGTWNHVDANIVFSYDTSVHHPQIGPLQILVRGMPATREGSSPRYRAAWDRTAYWLDFDGDGPAVPHLLTAVQQVGHYVPATLDDPYPEFAKNPAVIDECTLAQPCTVDASPFVALREPGVDYGNYPDGAASADLLFVTNTQGEAIAAALDVYDENDEYVETKDLYEGDVLELSMLGYKLSEPEYIYVITHTDFVTLEEGLRIELGNHVPGEDFTDPLLPPDLNAGQRRMKLLLDARAGTDTHPVFAFGGPYELGFTWRQTLNFVHRDTFEALQVSPTRSSPDIVKRRSMTPAR